MGGQLSNGVSTNEIINQQIMISGTDPLARGLIRLLWMLYSTENKNLRPAEYLP